MLCAMKLKPIYDSAKSFYGKAKVNYIYTHDINNKQTTEIQLISYNTTVAKVFKDWDGVITYIYLGSYSRTTDRHQKEFFRQQGLTDSEIKELKKNGTLTHKV